MIESVASQPDRNPITAGLTENNEMGRDAFLRLLTTQLSYQDPLDPVKNEDFVAQLAQFSSLEQLTSINEAVSSSKETDATASLQRSIEANTAIGLIGREVEVPADSIGYSGDGSVSLGYSLLGPANNVTLRVVDGSGNLVRTLVKDNPDVGTGSLVWDGKTDSGAQAPGGSYVVLASATNGSGNAVTVAPALIGEVTGVTYDADGHPVLQLAGGQAPLSSVSRVTQGN